MFLYRIRSSDPLSSVFSMICFNLPMIHHHKRGSYNLGGGCHELSVDLSKVVNGRSEVLILRQSQFPTAQKITVYRTMQEEDSILTDLKIVF